MARSRMRVGVGAITLALVALLVLLGFSFFSTWSADRVAVVEPPIAGESVPPAAAPDRAPLELASDGIPIVPATGAPPEHEGPMHPHPITTAHERIFRENNLVGALNLAVDLKDAPRIRELVAEYRQDYPEDAHRLQEGYALIGDCLENLDAETRARARHFWQTEIRSQTRRYVRRHCLDNHSPPLAQGVSP